MSEDPAKARLGSSDRTPSFSSLALKQWEQQGIEPFSDYLLSIDPGKTTGYAVFHNVTLTDSGQLKTPTIDETARGINELILQYKPGLKKVVVEDYRIYSWKAKDHTWSDLLTPRVIGCVETLCALSHIPLIKQSPQNAKQFVTDDRLREWELYVKGKVHARDAIRHGCYYLLFNHKG